MSILQQDSTQTHEPNWGSSNKDPRSSYNFKAHSFQHARANCTYNKKWEVVHNVFEPKHDGSFASQHNKP